MATRHYTEEAYEQIKQTIEQIDNTDVSPVKDFFSDLLLRLGQFLKLYSVEQYQNDMQTWYTKVLDSHNATMSQVDSIFNAVDTVDFEYRDIMDGGLDSIVSFRSTLNCLRNVISGKTSLADGKAAATGYLAAGTSSLNSSCDEILTKMQQRTLWDASKALFGDAINLGAGYVKCLYGKGNIADYKNLGDTILATGCDLLSMAAIVIAPLGALGDALDGKMDMSYEDYIDAQFMLLSPAQKLKDVNSVSDLLDNLAEDMGEQREKCPQNSPMFPFISKTAHLIEKTAKNYKMIDIAVDAYGIGKDLKDIHDTVDGWMYGKDYTVSEFVDEFEHKSFNDWEIIDRNWANNEATFTVKDTASGIVKKVVSNWFGVPTTGWNDPSKFDGNVYKTVGTLWSYAEKIIPDIDGGSNIDALPDVFFGKHKDTGFLKDIFDFARDLDEYSSNLGSGGSQSGSGGVKGGRYGWSLRKTGVS